jgi:hypothetical protein
MVQRVKGRIALPLSAAQAAVAKAIHNVKSIVPIIDGAGAEVFAKSTGTLVIREDTRKGDKITSSRARALSACHGKRGCEFAQCADTALGGRAPKNLMKACGRGPSRPTREELAGAGAALRGMR